MVWEENIRSMVGFLRETSCGKLVTTKERERRKTTLENPILRQVSIRHSLPNAITLRR
jgi:hypothetical protein